MNSTPPDATASLRRLAEHVPIDLGLAVDGYLTGPERGSLRFIHRLDHLAYHLQSMRFEVYWDAEMVNPLGWCAAVFHRITLAGFLFWEDPSVVREVLAHELTHGAFPQGKSEAWTREATWSLWGETIRTMAR